MSRYHPVVGGHDEPYGATEDTYPNSAINVSSRPSSISSERRTPLEGTVDTMTCDVFHRVSLDESSYSETLRGTNSSAASTRPTRGVDPLSRQYGDEGGNISKSSPKSKIPPSDQGLKRKRVLTRIQHAQHPWLLEFLALFICVLAFGAMLGLLARFDNKLVSEWKEKRISINTAISILAGITRGSLALAVSACIAQSKWNWFTKFEEILIDFDRFDAASRGPWGACRLISTFIRRPHWIALGALSTITLVGYEPSLQALISFDNKPFVQTSNGAWSQLDLLNKTNSSLGPFDSSAAALGKCRDLNVGSLAESDNSPMAAPNIKSGGKLINKTFVVTKLNVEFGMTAAIWNGFSDLFNASTLRSNFVCATGNCSWDEFASLAVCSECKDISKYLLKKSGSTKVPNSSGGAGSPNNTIPDISNPGKINPLWEIPENDTHDVNITKYTILQSGLNLSNYNGGPQCIPNSQNCADTYMSAKIITNPGQTILFQKLQTMILAAQTIEPDLSWKNKKTLWEETPVKARECSLYFCVNAYRSAVEQGVLQENVLFSWSNRTAHSFSNNYLADQGYDEVMNYTLDYSRGMAFTDLQVYVPKNAKTDPYRLDGETFNISQSTIVGMLQVFANGFGNQTLATHNGTINEFPNLIYPSLGGPAVPNFMVSLSESADIGGTFQNLASSLSKWMRDREFSSSPLTGRVMQTMLVTRVRWLYLILPLCTLLMGGMFVGLSIYQTHQMRLPAWKTDSLVSPVHGSSAELGRDLDAAAARNKLYETAKKTRVSMKDTDGLPKLGINDER